MKQKIKLCVLLVMLACQAEADPNQTGTAADSLENHFSANTQHNENLLRMQERHNDQILNTVYWFIGTTTALFAVMLGFGWFSNNRDNKKNQDTLKKLVESEIKEKKEGLDKSFSEYFTVIEDKLDKQNRKTETLLKNMESTILEEVETEITKIKYELAEIAYEKWMNQKVYANACRYAKKMLEYSIRLEQDYFQSKALDIIHSLLKSTAYNLKLDADEARSLIAVMQKLDETHRVIIETIIKAIADSR